MDSDLYKNITIERTKSRAFEFNNLVAFFFFFFFFFKFNVLNVKLKYRIINLIENNIHVISTISSSKSLKVFPIMISNTIFKIVS